MKKILFFISLVLGACTTPVLEFNNDKSCLIVKRIDPIGPNSSLYYLSNTRNGAIIDVVQAPENSFRTGDTLRLCKK